MATPRATRVLSHAGAVAREAVRGGDFIGRLGGEEFLVLLPDTDLEGARTAAEKLRLALRDADLGGLGRPVTASLGVAAARGSEERLRELVSDADAALYRAKAAGRDRVEAGRPPHPLDAAAALLVRA